MMARHRRLLPSGSLLVLTWLLLVHGCGSDGDGAGGNGRPPAADQGAGADGQDAASDAAGGAADAGTGATDGSGGEDITAAADGAATDLGPQLSPLAIPEGCNPLAADWDCLLPFPSDVFLAADPALPGGRRLVLPERARPRPAGIEEPLDFTVLHPADGFSHLPPILALFPDGVAPGPLTFHDEDTSQTLLPESPTLLLEAAGGQPVRHFAELDPRTLDRSRQALLLRPLARLKDSTRYVVALRGLRSPRGQLLPVPEGFRRIRDGQTGGDPVLAPLAARYEREVFPVLEAAGVRRASLQLAWDFTTESAELTEGDLRAVRADLIDRLEAEPPPVTVERVQDEVDAFIFRRIQARMSVPLYLEQSAPEALLHRDDQGRVTANGTVEVPITVQIPRSVATGQAAILPVRVLQFGHGFFSNRGEADGTFPRD
ncbi:MAG: hypothetical protein FJ125_17945, partial [Deltaproteobacteria bacterium]|nr:hypothetical protein [Deltaproteobacteria bacterium]